MPIVPLPGLPLRPLMTIAWHDARRAMRAMSGVALSVYGILIGTDALSRMLVGGASGEASGWPSMALSWAISLATSFLLIHYMIIVHRFVILDEVATRFRLEPRDRLTWRFFWTWVALTFLPALLAILVIGMLRDDAGRADPIGLIGIVIWIGVLVLATRLSVLLPAIAVGAPGATWAGALRDTKGHTWRILVAFLVPGIVFMAAAVLMTLMVTIVDMALGSALMRQQGVIVVLLTLLYDAIVVVATTYFVALASRLFQQVADSMTRSTPPPSFRPPGGWPPPDMPPRDRNRAA